MPAFIAKSEVWTKFRDNLIAGHYLVAARRGELEAKLRGCNTPKDFLEFAGRVFPAHQVEAEILGFLDLAQGIAPRTVMEIGTAQGGTNFLLGAALPEVTLKLGVDLYVQNTRLLQAYSRPGCRQEFVNGSSYAPETVARVERILGGRQLDVLFIDGDHTYAGVKADFESYRHLVRPGGLVAFHDIMEDYKTSFGRDTGRYAGEVPRYWKDVKSQFPQTWEFVADREQDGLGIGVGRMA